MNLQGQVQFEQKEAWKGKEKEEHIQKIQHNEQKISLLSYHHGLRLGQQI